MTKDVEKRLAVGLAAAGLLVMAGRIVHWLVGGSLLVRKKLSGDREGLPRSGENHD
jgi:hypothetical protein